MGHKNSYTVTCMTRNETLLKRYELFVAASAIAAHANWGVNGFRQRDVRVLIELFANWVEGSLRAAVYRHVTTKVRGNLESVLP